MKECCEKVRCMITEVTSATNGKQFYCAVHRCYWTVPPFGAYPVECPCGEYEPKEASDENTV